MQLENVEGTLNGIHSRINERAALIKRRETVKAMPETSVLATEICATGRGNFGSGPPPYKFYVNKDIVIGSINESIAVLNTAINQELKAIADFITE